MHGGREVPWSRVSGNPLLTTGFFNDKRTGKALLSVLSWASYGWDAKLGRPVWNSLLLDDGHRAQEVLAGCALIKWPDDLKRLRPRCGGGMRSGPSTLSARATTAVKVCFHTMRKTNHSAGWPTCRKPTEALKNQTPFSIGLPGARVVKTRLPLPRCPMASTQEGLGTDVRNNLANPFTGASLPGTSSRPPCMGSPKSPS